MGKILRAQQDQQRVQFIQLVPRAPDFKQLLGPKGWMALLRPSIVDLALNPDDVLPSEERVRELEQVQFIQMLSGARQAQAEAETAEAEGQAQPEGQEPAPGSVAERRAAA